MATYLWGFYDGREIIKKEKMTYEKALKEAREMRQNDYPEVTLFGLDEGDPTVQTEVVNLDSGIVDDI